MMPECELVRGLNTEKKKQEKNQTKEKSPPGKIQHLQQPKMKMKPQIRTLPVDIFTQIYTSKSLYAN